ncbi:MAG: ParB family protein, partial [Gammaproteobacteria bacterium]
MSERTPTVGDRLKQQPHFGAPRALRSAEPLEPTPMVVLVNEIQEYDRNPREARNVAYDRIKESIRQRGFNGVLRITRRPGEPHYIVAEGGNTALHILKELYAETRDPKFQSISCLYEPWTSESETLIAHLVENDARGDLIFIDRARALCALRGLLEQERGMALSTRELAVLLRERGYSIDPATITRLDYARETLLPHIPLALRAGLGRPAIDRIRKLEKMLTRYLTQCKLDQPVIEEVRQWFLVCLARHDRGDWLLEPLQAEIEACVADLCGVNREIVCAALDPPDILGGEPEGEASIRSFVSAPEHPSAAEAPTTEAKTRRIETHGNRYPQQPGMTEEVSDMKHVDLSYRASKLRMPQTRPDLPQDPKSLRGRMWTLATQLAMRNGLAKCILRCPKGCGYLVDLPGTALYAKDRPETAEEAKRVTL